MATITFGSVGDIIALCQVITTIVRSLSSTQGSSAEYESLINSLWSLAQALECAKFLLEQNTPLQFRGRLGTVLQNCHACLDHELDRVRKYTGSLSSKGSGSRTKDTVRKIRWQSHKVHQDSGCGMAYG